MMKSAMSMFVFWARGWGIGGRGAIVTGNIRCGCTGAGTRVIVLSGGTVRRRRKGGRFFAVNMRPPYSGNAGNSVHRRSRRSYARARRSWKWCLRRSRSRCNFDDLRSVIWRMCGHNGRCFVQPLISRSSIGGGWRGTSRSREGQVPG